MDAAVVDDACSAAAVADCSNMPLRDFARLGELARRQCGDGGDGGGADEKNR